MIDTLLFTGLPTQAANNDDKLYQKILLAISIQSDISIDTSLITHHRSEMLAAYIDGLKKIVAHSGIYGWINSLFEE